VAFRWEPKKLESFDPNLIPGMIEPVERELLRRLAREVPFREGDCAVEFGAFFGKSTAFIAKGLAERSGYSPRLYTFDSFGCDSKGGFRSAVLGFAEAGGVLHLIHEEGGRVDFQRVFNFYLKQKVDCGAVIAIRAELEDSVPVAQPIMLMHIDSPKMYVDFKPIFFRFFPKMRIGAVIVFQDFFYHWSATLIAAVAMLERHGILEFRESAASSLVCVLRKTIDERIAIEIDLALSSEEKILDCIDYAAQSCGNITLDRPDIFLPRLQLAKIQWLMERGDERRAAMVLAHFFQRGGKLNHAIISDFIDLMSNAFSILRLYRLDHRSLEAKS
jgi:hypothetical protein